VQTASADIEQAKANVLQAQLNLSYTKIYAPEDGRVTKKAVEEGTFVQVGQALLALVPQDFWVTANFKETQLAQMQVGQPVAIKVDAYPDKVFKGHVDSFQTGTGARFSLLPPENATGNYVKVVQRVPVKIVFDEQPDPQHPLGPGMSVEPEVEVK
jgi:membrane fusion protein (multidrug efflux system)